MAVHFPWRKTGKSLFILMLVTVGLGFIISLITFYNDILEERISRAVETQTSLLRHP